VTFVLPTLEEKLAGIRSQLRLEGESVIRRDRVRPDGSPWVIADTGACGLATRVGVTVGHRRAFTTSVPRIKFYLTYGWMPQQVCHRDGDFRNNELANLFPRDEPPGGFYPKS
jgi:hypothetical protein